MKNMKMIYVAIAFLVGGFIMFGQYRKFYCLLDGRCVTVWKRIGGTCFIIPGKYFGVFRPSTGYIKTTNDNNATIYWKKTLPSKIIVRIDPITKYEIINGSPETTIEDFNNNKVAYLNYILYPEGPAKFRDVHPDVEYIAIAIKENYARDKQLNIL
jgi:hypothetical protein